MFPSDNPGLYVSVTSHDETDEGAILLGILHDSSSCLMTMILFCVSDCQYTCHHKCLPQITLDCKSVSHDETDEGAVLLGDTSLSSDLSTSAALHAEFASEPATVSIGL